MDLPDLTLDPKKFGTAATDIEVVSEAGVLMTVRGYAPVVEVRDLRNGLRSLMFVGAKSLSEPLEQRRRENGGRFKGLRLAIRKESADATSKYVVTAISEKDAHGG